MWSLLYMSWFWGGVQQARLTINDPPLQFTESNLYKARAWNDFNVYKNSWWKWSQFLPADICVWLIVHYSSTVGQTTTNYHFTTITIFTEIKWHKVMEWLWYEGVILPGMMTSTQPGLCIKWIYDPTLRAFRPPWLITTFVNLELMTIKNKLFLLASW